MNIIGKTTVSNTNFPVCTGCLQCYIETHPVSSSINKVNNCRTIEYKLYRRAVHRTRCHCSSLTAMSYDEKGGS